MTAAERLESVKKRILAAGGRDVTLVAVSKTFAPAQIRELYDLGVRDFGENKVQELTEKKDVLPADIRWHMIGRLQTNKVKDVLGQAALIHSVDRADLFEKIETEAAKRTLEPECLLQVNISGEASKAGFTPTGIKDFLRGISVPKRVKICGLMTMAPLTENQEIVRKTFQGAKKLSDELKAEFPQFQWKLLSMGMSGDFEIAVEEGATVVRIGSALFGTRQQQET